MGKRTRCWSLLVDWVALLLGVGIEVSPDQTQSNAGSARAEWRISAFAWSRNAKFGISGLGFRRFRV